MEVLLPILLFPCITSSETEVVLCKLFSFDTSTKCKALNRSSTEKFITRPHPTHHELNIAEYVNFDLLYHQFHHTGVNTRSHYQ